MLNLLSGPFFLLLYKVWHHGLPKQGIIPQNETQYRVLLSDNQAKLYPKKEWKDLKEISFLFFFTLSIYLSLLFITLNSEQQQQNGETSVTKTQQEWKWDRNTMVRDSYLYNVESLPLSLSKEKREFSENGEEGVSFKETVFLRHPQEGVILTRRMILQSEVLLVLQKIQGEEGEDCICPVFLGIRGNLSFLFYNEKEWIIMYDPFVSWHPRDARLIKRRTLFKEDSKFNGFLQEPHRRDLYQQYDRFTVTFNSPSRQEGMQRISLPLGGKEAVCFTFCQNQQLEWHYVSL